MQSKSLPHVMPVGSVVLRAGVRASVDTGAIEGISVRRIRFEFKVFAKLVTPSS